MKKVFFIIVLTILFNKASYAEYYFKECKIDTEYLANYIINFEQEIIKVRFIKKDGYSQEWKDKIETVAKNRVTSKIIQSKKNKEYFTQYYLDTKSKSVFRQRYRKKHDLDILRPDGPKIQSYCENVKADWDVKKIEEDEAISDLEQVLKTQEKILSEKTSIPECEGNNYEGWKNCKGKYTAEDGSEYIGYFKDGKIEEGSAKYPGGSKYVGKFKNNKPDGLGTFTYPDGSKYVGDWKNGLSHGNGIRTWKDGRKYVGKFKDDKPHGQGTFTYPDGSKYVGELKNGKRHGEGKLTYTDGRTYVGQFVDGEEHGSGTCFASDGSSIECKMDISTTGRDTHNILVSWKKWIKISEYETSSGKGKKAIDKLKIDFDKKASELCTSTKNFKVLEKKIVIVEMDETPAFGLETVVKIGIDGVIECK